MITPVKQYSFLFTADGTSTSLEIDASLLPIAEDFKGSIPVAVLLPTATSAYTGGLGSVTASLSGTTVTFTFGAGAPAKFDNNGVLIVYTGTFYLQYQT